MTFLRTGLQSIKYNAKFLSTIAKELTDIETRLVDPVDGTEALWASIKGAALKLKPGANVYDGTEIYEKTAGQRFVLPMVTPKFATYYGLKN